MIIFNLKEANISALYGLKMLTVACNMLYNNHTRIVFKEMRHLKFLDPAELKTLYYI